MSDGRAWAAEQDENERREKQKTRPASAKAVTTPQVRKGRYRDGTLPAYIQEVMDEVNPDWDWLQTGDYVVLRIFDEGREYERIAAKVELTREF